MNKKAKIKESILGLLTSRAQGKTICPSEAARSLWPDEWREHMEDVRDVGRSLEADGKIEVTQRGERVDPVAAIGPIRYRLPSE